MNTFARLASLVIALAFFIKSARTFHARSEYDRRPPVGDVIDRRRLCDSTSCYFVNGVVPMVLGESSIEIVNCLEQQEVLEARWLLSDDPSDTFMWRANM